MTAADVAFGDAPHRDGRRWYVAGFATAFALFGVLTAVFVFSDEGTYRELTRGRGSATFAIDEVRLTVDEGGLVALHERTLAYVLGEVPATPTVADGRPLFDENERGHLADVRAVFDAVRKTIVGSGLALVALLLIAARANEVTSTIRDGAIGSGILVLIVAILFAVAFGPAFLAFHYLFFPQGNFLFDPATSNLLRLYPESYWYGVTMRVGVSFVVAAGLIAALAHVAMRREVT